ncbi:hypothetical protein EII33_04065 [Bacteroides heparinolyticus]|uniref:HlyD family secretion protein n=1 Tax=Prevotella heparinolytica TaxID=28113 RepID=A0A3P2AE94_9BACE|nr:hypothetical protein [Bacteroides heparinolyticus]RRD92490.1 hypothetical protein EII33_04065 [Bacteroides heparinolyticus]
MEEKKKQERSFELRSEKVRSIVGQIPSSLVRYGITAIGVVLLCLFVIAYSLPYKQVYSGTATIHKIPLSSGDSTEISILLKFENKRPNDINGQALFLQTAQKTIQGEILEFSPVRDTLERQKTICRFRIAAIKPLENQTVDFRVVKSSGNLFQKLLWDVSM